MVMEAKDIEDKIDDILDLDTGKEYLITLYLINEDGMRAHAFTNIQEVFKVLSRVLEIVKQEKVDDLELEMDIDKIVWMKDDKG